MVAGQENSCFNDTNFGVRAKGGGQIYVSFSGGKDSTVLLDLVRRAYPDAPAVFVDTGLEYPEVRQFAKSKENVIVLKPEMSFRKVIEKYGYPLISKQVANTIEYANPGTLRWELLHGNIKKDNGKPSEFNCQQWAFLKDAPFKVSSRCCNVMKKKPLHKFDKESGLKPIIGTMASESRQRQAQWLTHGCNSFDANNPASKPISFWTEQDIFEYIKRYNLPYASVYGDIVENDGKLCTTGCDRTGCVFCGFGCHLEKEPNRFQQLKETHPKLYKYCMKPWENGGLGMKNVMDYINVPT